MDLGGGWAFNAELTAEYFDSRVLTNPDEFFFKGSLKGTRVLNDRWTAWAEAYWNVPSKSNAYVTVDVGVDLAALVTPGSVRRLGLEVGRQVWLSFKATAGRFFEE